MDPLDNDVTENEIIDTLKDHESVKSIKIHQNTPPKNTFEFRPVCVDYVKKQLSKLNIRKSTGAGMLTPRLVKLSANELARPITNLINMSISHNIFPDVLKNAEISPLFKKK